MWHDWMLTHFSGHRWRGWCTAYGGREMEGLWPMNKKMPLFPAMRFFIYMGEMGAWNLSMLYNSSQLTDRVKHCGVIYRHGGETVKKFFHWRHRSEIWIIKYKYSCGVPLRSAPLWGVKALSPSRQKAKLFVNAYCPVSSCVSWQKD